MAKTSVVNESLLSMPEAHAGMAVTVLDAVDMAIEEVGEINMVLLPAQNTDLLWRTCQVGAAGKTSRITCARQEK